jgi:hypothetical protein
VANAVCAASGPRPNPRKRQCSVALSSLPIGEHSSNGHSSCYETGCTPRWFEHRVPPRSHQRGPTPHFQQSSCEAKGAGRHPNVPCHKLWECAHRAPTASSKCVVECKRQL